MKISPNFNGVVIDQTNEQYHKGPGISKSGLDCVDRSLSHYYHLYLDPNRPKQEEKGGQFEGTLAHCAILERSEFSKRYVVEPDDAPRRPTIRQLNAENPSEATLKAIEYWKHFKEANPDKRVISKEQLKVALAQSKAVFDLPDIAQLLAVGEAETSAYYTDPETGVLCKCRPDFVHHVDENSVILIDVKTFNDASPKEFARQVARKRYHVQDAYYRDVYAGATGKKVLAFVFLTVETQWPFKASASMLTEQSVEQGRIEYRRNLEKYAQGVKSNNWTGFEGGIELISLPGWALSDVLSGEDYE